MAHVVVIDSTARRAQVKVTPGTHLSDVLGEGCRKLKLNPSLYGMKHKNKQLDLSLSFRLSGLSSGAKLELVQLSRSPSVVSVALQVPPEEAQGIPNGRLLDKFPSSTTIWLILRKFEAGVAGTGVKHNFTARGVPVAGSNNNGSGRLFYQFPVVQAMERELSSFVDLQKTLGQLGFNNGSVLLRLSYRATQQPLEEAMVEIEGYFKSVEGHSGTNEQPQPTPSNVEPTAATNAEETSTDTTQPTPEPPPQISDVQTEPSQEAATAPQAPAEQQTPLTVSSKPVTVFSAPTNVTPQSIQANYNADDYVPTIEHAKAHQRYLNASSRPIRLPTDAEIAAQESAAREKLATISSVEVRVRFPDQEQVQVTFSQDDTAATLYGFVRSCLAEQFMSEKFTLSTFATGNRGPTILADTDQRSRLIRDLGMKGRVLVNFNWDDSAALAARRSGTPLLKPELRSQAQQMKIQDVPGVTEEEERPSASSAGAASTGASTEGKPGARKGGIPKWLKLPGKK